MEGNLQYAIIKAGGKQYRVSVGESIRVNRISDCEKGAEYVINEVLAVGNGSDEASIGTPLVSGASVTCKVVGDCRGRKVIAFKRRRRKGYCRKIGHRQDLTELLIKEIKLA